MNNISGTSWQLSLISLLLFVVSLLMYFYAPTQMVSNVLLLLVPFFYLVSLASRYILHKATEKNKNKISNYFFAIAAVKFFLFLMVMIIYGFIYREDAIPFLLSFFIFYLIYSYLDTRVMMKFLSK
jgi:hypothetical protein